MGRYYKQAGVTAPVHGIFDVVAGCDYQRPMQSRSGPSRILTAQEERSTGAFDLKSYRSQCDPLQRAKVLRRTSAGTLINANLVFNLLPV